MGTEQVPTDDRRMCRILYSRVTGSWEPPDVSAED